MEKFQGKNADDFRKNIQINIGSAIGYISKITLDTSSSVDIAVAVLEDNGAISHLKFLDSKRSIDPWAEEYVSALYRASPSLEYVVEDQGLFMRDYNPT